jgi:hypothetical protein
VLPALAGLLGASCWTLTTDVEDLSSGRPPPNDAAPSNDGGPLDAQTPPDARPVDGHTCEAIKKARPNSTDGTYRLDPDDDGPVAPFDAFCDMTRDEGGWMLVTPALLSDPIAVQTTPVTSADPVNGGAVIRVYANHRGCAEEVEHARHLVMLAKGVSWTRLRAKQIFAGAADCWTIFGGVDPKYPLPHGIIPFEPGKDVARDAVRMGGDAGDGFAGATRRCDLQPDNFWNHTTGTAERSVTVILRRQSGAPAGLATLASCLDEGPGTTSPTWWEYRDVYVQ